ncbi:TatD family hydrolase [Methylibium sp.]|uniref:TatD family hydrolase n=1 Tax=Methylibium sp. TaxID=2067992 RepID=UPI003D0C1C0D
MAPPTESAPTAWTDTHCHLDAPEFGADRAAVVARARAAGVTQIVLPAVAPFDFDTVRALAHEHGLAYALGIHPLYTDPLDDGALDSLRAALEAQRDDPRLVAVGEIGLDHFVPGGDRAKQEHFYVQQLALARAAGLPVLLHVRRSADSLLKQLRRAPVGGGIAHAFNGSRQQAQAFVALGFKLGFGGAMSFERALQLRRLATELPLDAIVLETDAPDIAPQWLYKTAAQRAAGERSRNEPAELPRIAAQLAALRGLSLPALAAVTQANARAVLPRLAALDLREATA